MRYWQIFILLCSFICTDVFSHSRDSLHINKYNISDGLPDSTINAIAQDGLGFMWFGTDDGLVRYDGVRFTRFNRQHGLKNKSNKVTQIFRDENNNLWVSYECSVHILLANENQFTYGFSLNSSKSVSKSVSFIAQLSPHVVALSSAEGLYLANPKRITSDPHYIPTDEPITGYVELDGRNLFIGTTQLYTLSPDRQTLNAINLGGLPNDVNITSSTIYNNQLVVGTYQHGVYTYDRYLNYQDNTFLDMASPTQPRVTAIDSDTSKRLWVSTANKGIFLFDSGQKSHHLRFDPTDPHSISTNSIRTLYQSQNGDMWIGSQRGGINHFKKTSEQLYHLKHSVLQDSPLSGNDVTAIAADKYLRGWMASNTDGISVYSPSTNISVVINQALPGLTVSNIHIQDQYAWVLDEQGITQINIDTLKVVNTYTPQNSKLAYGGLVDWLSLSPESALLTHRNNGVSLFNLAELTFEHFTIDNSSLPTNQFNQMLNLNGIEWLSSNMGLHTFDQRTKEFQHYLFSAQQNINQVNHITSNPQDHIVLSTNSGIHIFDPLSKTFLDSNFPSFISDTNIQATLITDEGVLWSTMKNGAVEYRDHSQHVSWYTEADGLQGNEFNPGVAYKNSRGLFVFSGLNGITVLNPSRLSKLPIKLQLAQLQVFYSDGSEESLFNIHDNNFTFNRKVDAVNVLFGDTNFTTHPQVKFELYSAEGKVILNDFSAVLSPKSGPTSFSIVNPRYQYDNLMAEPITLSLSYPKPWYLTFWAFALYLTGLIIGIYLIVTLRTRQVKRTAADLALIVEKRTDDLRRQTEISRQQTLKLEQTVAEKDAIFETISHELRTPLTLIQGPVQQLRNYQMEPEAQTMLNILVRNADRLNTLVKKVFELSVSDKLPDTKHNTAITDLSLVIQQLALIFTPYTEQQKQTFTYPKFAPLKVTVPMYNLETILSNLLSNAVKYTEKGGDINIDVETDSHFVTIHVSDTGAGIEEKDIPLIFNRFYRAHSEQVEGEDGSGLGLAIVEQLVDKADGLIKVNSELGKGTQFSVILPNNLNQKYIPTVSEEERPCVLCIDDNNDILTYLENLFKDEYQIHTANSSTAGLTLAKDLLPDLIISDIMMPEMDGIELLNTLKADIITNHIPVILLTAKNSKAARLEGLASAASDYINKPFEEEELRLKTRNIIAEQEAIRRKYIKSVANLNTLDDDTNTTSQSDFIEQLHAILKEHHQKSDFTVQDLANLSNVSDRQLLRRLKNETGIGVSEFIRNYRLHRAADLLKAGKAASYAAYEAGFTSPSYFSTSFKKLFNMTPKQFAKKHRLNAIFAENS